MVTLWKSFFERSFQILCSQLLVQAINIHILHKNNTQSYHRDLTVCYHRYTKQHDLKRFFPWLCLLVCKKRIKSFQTKQIIFKHTQVFLFSEGTPWNLMQSQFFLNLGVFDDGLTSIPWCATPALWGTSHTMQIYNLIFFCSILVQLLQKKWRKPQKPNPSSFGNINKNINLHFVVQYIFFGKLPASINFCL